MKKYLLVLVFLLLLILVFLKITFYSNDEKMYDNIIIGGGVSGAYLAYKLTHMGKKVLLLESSSDVGGRLMSFPIDYAMASKGHTIIKNNDKIALEYGGMRFFPEHKIVTDLVNNVFKDTLKAVPVTYYTDTGTVYLRGNRIVAEDENIKNTIDHFYNIIGTNGHSVLKLTDTVPFDFFTKYIRDPVFKSVWNKKYSGTQVPDLDNYAKLDQDTQDKIVNILTSDPVFINESAGDFILQQLNTKVLNMNGQVSGSASEFIDSYIDTQGYSLFTLLPAGITILEDIDVLASSGQFFLENGYKTLVKALINGSKKELLEVKLNTTVKDVTKSNNVYNVNGNMQAKNIFNTTTPNRCMNWTINSKHSDLLNTVHSITTMKIFIQFKNIWWDPVKDSGKHITTLPFRQVWMYNQNPPIVMIYCDSDDARFFRAMVNKDIQTKLTPPNKSDMGDLVMNLDSLFKQMFDTYMDNNILQLGWAFLNPCCYFWNVRTNIQKSMDTASNPETGYYMAGDTWSIRQGWVEGALESCERSLTKYKTTS